MREEMINNKYKMKKKDGEIYIPVKNNLALCLDAKKERRMSKHISD